jgi:two-component system nitrogen regulation response regulator GlnG
MQQTTESPGAKRAVAFQVTKDTARAVSGALKGETIVVGQETRLADVRRLFRSRHVDFLFIGSSYLLRRGGAFLSSIRKERRDLSIVVCVSNADRERILPLLDARIEAVVFEPYHPKEILFAVASAERIARARAKDRGAEDMLGNLYSPHKAFIGRSANAHEVRKEVTAARKGGGHAYVIGESGTGKTLLSYCIHIKPKEAPSPIRVYDPVADAQKKRGVASLIGDIAPSETLVVKNSQALSGREIATLDAAIKKGYQGQVRVSRLIVHHDPSAGAAERLDRTLFPHVIRILPLRERVEDIGAIFGYYVNCLSAALHAPRVSITPAARRVLVRYRWPKNVNELIGVVIYAMVTGNGGSVDPLMLPDFITKDDPDAFGRISLEDLLASKLKPIVSKMSLDKVEGLYNIILARMEMPLIKMVLEETGQNRSKAAKVLGINRNTLKKKIDQYRIAK